MKSVCYKVACRKEDGSKQNMIVTKKRKTMFCKQKLSISYNEESTDNDEDEDEHFDNEDCVLKQTWENISPPIPKEEIIGKWYGMIYIYSTKNRKLLYIGKFVQRFLLAEGDQPMPLPCNV